MNPPTARSRQPPSPAESPALSSSSTAAPSLSRRRHKIPTCYSTASLHRSVDARAFLNCICTPASLLWDLRYTSQQRPSFTPPLRTSSSPAVRRTPVIARVSLHPEDNIEEMDKRHPSSFQQLEKLGEGTYATVWAPFPHILHYSPKCVARKLTRAGLQRTEPPDRRAGSPQGDPSRFRRGYS